LTFGSLTVDTAVLPVCPHGGVLQAGVHLAGLEVSSGEDTITPRGIDDVVKGNGALAVLAFVRGRDGALGRVTILELYFCDACPFKDFDTAGASVLE
jgi:hypothetical protein